MQEKKKAEEEAARELAALFATAIKQPKVPPGVDPKSIVCEYFRAGQCTKVRRNARYNGAAPLSAVSFASL